MQFLACACDILACMTQNEDIGHLAHCIDTTASYVYCSVCACMQAQAKGERGGGGEGKGEGKGGGVCRVLPVI